MEIRLETKTMKLTQETLKRIIKEELDEAFTSIDPNLSTHQTDPNEGLFHIMDQVMDRALEILGINKADPMYREVEGDMSRISNEVVSSRIANIDEMAQELAEKYKAMRG
jgi:PAB1-binding protein PBP1